MLDWTISYISAILLEKRVGVLFYQVCVISLVIIVIFFHYIVPNIALKRPSMNFILLKALSFIKNNPWLSLRFRIDSHKLFRLLWRLRWLYLKSIWVNRLGFWIIPGILLRIFLLLYYVFQMFLYFLTEVEVELLLNRVNDWT